MTALSKHAHTAFVYTSSVAVVLVLVLTGAYMTRGHVVPLAQKHSIVPLMHIYAYVDVHAAMWLGEHYFTTANYNSERAERFYRRTSALDPTNALAHYQLGRIAFIRGRFKEAHAHIDAALRYDPTYYRGYYMRGLIAGYEKDYKKAADAFYIFLQYDSIGWAGYNDLSWIYFQQGNFAAAEEIAIFGLGYAPENPWLHNSVGVAQLAQGRKDEARAHFRRALDRIDTMTPDDWGIAYPGNDPAIYAAGLTSMRDSIVHNLAQ